MIDNWPLSRRRLLAAALLVIAALLVETLIRAPLAAQRQAYQAEAEIQRQTAERYRQNLIRIESEIAEASAVADDPALTAAFLHDADDGQAVAALQRLVEETAAEEGLEPQSLRVLPPVVDDGVRRIGIAIDLETTGDPLIRLIRRLERERPLVRVGALEVQTLEEDGGALKVGLEAHGLMPEAPL